MDVETRPFAFDSKTRTPWSVNESWFDDNISCDGLDDLSNAQNWKLGKNEPFSFHGRIHALESGSESSFGDVVDFDGLDDPAKAQNWRPGKKWTMITVLALMTFISTLASTMFAPSVPSVMMEFRSTSTTLSTFVVSVYVLGNATGPLILAPLSELFGRAPVYHATNALYVICTAACALSANLSMLIVFRFFAGAMGAAVLSLGGGTITDLFIPEQRGTAMAVWSLGPLLGPVVGPVAGGFISSALGWRWIFWILTIASGVVTIAYYFFVPESYSPALLEKKASLLRERGNPYLRSKLASPLSRSATLYRAIVRPTQMLLFCPVVTLLSIFIAVVYGQLYLLYTTITFVFEEQYHFAYRTSGLAFLGLGVGMLLGAGIFGAVSDRTLKAKEKENGLKPEYRLPVMMYGIVIIPIGLVIYGWTAEKHVMWIAPIIGTAFVGAGMMATFAYLVDAFPLYSASAVAANTVLRSIAGAFLPLAGPRMYSSLGLGWGNSLLALIAVMLIPFPALLIIYGERLRKLSRFEFVLSSVK
ncbi:MFS general substrate transporter [Mollisia scopiformis]|uniref:MFS general substrate transporter n=1 Tax=Mollisia scopiformis TaxID=149040 RepID=A0A194WY06_MOLSC|nr:MFS general substrate transporter [Mollisia scopiformis]KUJ12853.1 MFS general substrate transporter [Mollisia scopiformis]